MTKTYVASTAALLCAALAAGCTDGTRHLSPSGPTPAAAVEPGGSSTLSHSVASTAPASVDAAATAAWAMRHGFASTPDGLLVEGVDVLTAIEGTCPDATITVRGVPVRLTATTTFTAPLTCGTLEVGATVRITGVLTFDPPDFSVTATTVALDSSETPTPPTGPGPAPGPGGKKARGEGTVGAITGACPTLTLIITGTRVQTSATTAFTNGTCESLRPGTKVRIDGVLNPGGDATAEMVEILRTPGRPVSGDGKVDRVEGTCPAVTLTVRGVTVMTSSSTTFSGGTCADIGPGTQIDVTGDYDGESVDAVAIRIKPRGHR